MAKFENKVEIFFKPDELLARDKWNVVQQLSNQQVQKSLW